ADRDPHRVAGGADAVGSPGSRTVAPLGEPSAASCTTRPGRARAVQTPPPAGAIATTVRPTTGASASLRPVRASRRVTRASGALDTQTVPPAIAIALG